MREYKFMLLGPFRVMDGTRILPAQMLRKAQDLLTIMLIAPDRRVLREAAAEALWPDAHFEASKKRMRQALWQIHRAVDNGAPQDQRLVLSDGEALYINPGRRLWVDVPVFIEAVRLAQDAGSSGLRTADLIRLTGAADLYRGPLHAGCYNEWCLIPRARLEDQCLTLLETLSHEHERQAALDLAIMWAQRLLDVEPAHERSHRRLMYLYFRTGDRTRALRQFHRCRRILEHDLGVHPDERTEKLGAAIRADRLPAAADLGDFVLSHPGGPAVLDGIRTELSALRRSVDAIGQSLGDAPV
jgi:DNA-binding SARP family transcriptional activator